MGDVGVESAVEGGLMVSNLDHYTLRCREDEIEGLAAFYGRTLGLRPGRRPDFDFQGVWLYIGEAPVVHVAARLPEGAADAAPGQTGRFDHLSFFSHDRAGLEARLRGLGVEFHGTPVPGFPLYQLFFHDPVGVKVEVTFRT